MSFYIPNDAYTNVNVGMGIGILIPEAMISKSTIDKLASVDEKEILTLSDLVQFAEYVRDVVPNCLRTQEKLLCNFLVVQSL